MYAYNHDMVTISQTAKFPDLSPAAATETTNSLALTVSEWQLKSVFKIIRMTLIINY